MTIKTLKHIHYLLCKDVAEKKEAKDEALETLREFKNKERTDTESLNDLSEYEFLRKDYDAKVERWNEAVNALDDFEAKEW